MLSPRKHSNEYSKVPTVDTTDLPRNEVDNALLLSPSHGGRFCGTQKIVFGFYALLAGAVSAILYQGGRDRILSGGSPPPSGGGDGAMDHIVLPGAPNMRKDRDPDPQTPWPRVAWLMSYPNSGTSYTMQFVQRATNLTVATNYGRECDRNGLAPDGTNIPVNPKSPEGPFLLSPNTRALPERYVVTKTHCGGRCNSCAPKKYIMDDSTFQEWCLRGGKYVTDKHGKRLDYVNVYYNASLVQRAVHLIRNPFDNIVSNFHLEQHERIKKDDAEWLSRFPNNKNGFQEWCRYLDGKYTKEEKKHDGLDSEIMTLFEKVPCHADFYRYAQWHNHAIKTTKSMNLPTLVMHYEDYGTDYESLVESLMGFLQLPKNGEPQPFKSGKSYKKEFFTEEQRNATKVLLRTLSNSATWSLLERYDSPL